MQKHLIYIKTDYYEKANIYIDYNEREIYQAKD